MIEQIAAKLGTTSEYLWQVLLGQARVAAAIDMVEIVLMVALITLFVRWCGRHIEEIEEDDNVFLGLAVIFGGILSLVMIFFCFMNIREIVTAYFNPEYWALKEILKSIR